MKKALNWTGAKCKALVDAIAERMPVFQKAPTFAYANHNCAVEESGTFAFEAQTGAESAEPLPASVEPGEAITEDDTPDALSIEMPVDGFSDIALSNLEKLVASKAPLIKKSIGADDLPIVQQGDRLCFPWFRADSSADEVDAYTRLIHALCEMAKTQKRVTATVRPVESEKFAFRTFLVRLGFIGPEFASARKILLANLPGNGSFKGDKPKESIEPTPDEDCEEHMLAEALADAQLIYELNNAGTTSHEGDTLAEALADAELIHNLNTSFGGIGHDE